MVKKNLFFIILVLIVVVVGISMYSSKMPPTLPSTSPKSKIILGALDTNKVKSDDVWRKVLTPDQYHILREQGTEIPFTGVLDHESRKGTYYSVGCNEPVFRSEQKYDSGTGWPSFWAPITPSALVLREDDSLGEKRIEVVDQCGGHLGHVFDDGPQPTGKRYCMNSIALYFVPDNK